jgi:uncharacterized membrane protein YfcA
MKASGLPARIVYAAAALPVGGAAGFYGCIYLLPKLAERYPQLDPGGADGQGYFNAAIGVGVAVAFSMALLALTLPWSRHRERRGRAWRITVSSVVVVAASIAFAAEVHGLVYGLAFAAWMAYLMAYTFARYGVMDQTRRRSGSRREY